MLSRGAWPPMTTLAAPPLAVISKVEGYTALRLLMNDGDYVVLSSQGHTTCIKRKCIDAREATCPHVELVKSLSKEDIDAIPNSWLSRVRSDA